MKRRRNTTTTVTVPASYPFVKELWLYCLALAWSPSMHQKLCVVSKATLRLIHTREFVATIVGQCREGGCYPRAAPLMSSIFSWLSAVQPSGEHLLMTALYENVPISDTGLSARNVLNICRAYWRRKVIGSIALDPVAMSVTADPIWESAAPGSWVRTTSQPMNFCHRLLLEHPAISVLDPSRYASLTGMKGLATWLLVSHPKTWPLARPDGRKPPVLNDPLGIYTREEIQREPAGLVFSVEILSESVEALSAAVPEVLKGYSQLAHRTTSAISVLRTLWPFESFRSALWRLPENQLNSEALVECISLAASSGLELQEVSRRITWSEVQQYRSMIAFLQASTLARIQPIAEMAEWLPKCYDECYDGGNLLENYVSAVGVSAFAGLDRLTDNWRMGEALLACVKTSEELLLVPLTMIKSVLAHSLMKPELLPALLKLSARDRSPRLMIGGTDWMGESFVGKNRRLPDNEDQRRLLLAYASRTADPPLDITEFLGSFFQTEEFGWMVIMLCESGGRLRIDAKQIARFVFHRPSVLVRTLENQPRFIPLLAEAGATIAAVFFRYVVPRKSAALTEVRGCSTTKNGLVFLEAGLKLLLVARDDKAPTLALLRCPHCRARVEAALAGH